MNTDKDSLLGDAFLSNQKLNNSWMNSYDSICKSFGLPHSVPPGIMKKTMESNFLTKWQATLQRSLKNKLRSYETYKTSFGFENYLDTVTNNQHRVALTRIRTSSHYLRIETGRYIKSDNEEDDKKFRTCQLCKSNSVEDEKHFLTSCQFYKDLRKQMINDMSKICPNVNTLVSDANSLFIYLLTCEGAEADLIGKFCHDAFQARKYAYEFIAKEPKKVETRSGRLVKPRNILDL